MKKITKKEVNRKDRLYEGPGDVFNYDGVIIIIGVIYTILMLF